MEEAEVQHQPGGNTNWMRWALGAMAAALAFAVAISLAGGPARAQGAQCNGDPIYCIPTPTPTPTGTPFQNQNQNPPPRQPESGPEALKPFPVVRTAGSFSGSRTTFTR